MLSHQQKEREWNGCFSCSRVHQGAACAKWRAISNLRHIRVLAFPICRSHAWVLTCAMSNTTSSHYKPLPYWKVFGTLEMGFCIRWYEREIKGRMPKEQQQQQISFHNHDGRCKPRTSSLQLCSGILAAKSMAHYAAFGCRMVRQDAT